MCIIHKSSNSKYKAINALERLLSCHTLPLDCNKTLRLIIIFTWALTSLGPSPDSKQSCHHCLWGQLPHQWHVKWWWRCCCRGAMSKLRTMLTLESAPSAALYDIVFWEDHATHPEEDINLTSWETSPHWPTLTWSTSSSRNMQPWSRHRNNFLVFFYCWERPYRISTVITFHQSLQWLSV